MLRPLLALSLHAEHIISDALQLIPIVLLILFIIWNRMKHW